MCNGDNESAAMEQEWALKQTQKERKFQEQYEAWCMEQMDLKSYVIKYDTNHKHSDT